MKKYLIPALLFVAGVSAWAVAPVTDAMQAAYAKNEGFVDLVKAIDKSVSDLQAALFSQDVAAVKAALSREKVPYSKFFLKFG
jgi:hypothetical protein